MPFAGLRHYGVTILGNVGSDGIYWSSSPDDTSSAYNLYFSSSGIYPQISDYRSHGFSVRCFRNSPIVTYISDGEVIATQKSTEPAPTPTKEDYTFAGWYEDNETFQNKFDFSTPITADKTLYARWVQCPEGATYVENFDICINYSTTTETTTII